MIDLDLNNSKLGDGSELLLPMYFTPDGEFEREGQYSAVVRSSDGGRTWSNEAILPGTEGARGVQPAVVRIDSQKLVAFMRNRSGVGARILRSESNDDGRTWSEAGSA